MQVAVSSVGVFHAFDLARELHRHGHLAHIHSGYPWFKLRGEGLPRSKVDTYPWVRAPYMAFRQRHRLGVRCVKAWERLDLWALDRHVARKVGRPQVFVGMSGSGLLTGRVVRSRGGRHVCDRGSTHIRFYDQALREEHERWGAPLDRVDPWVIEREEAEYREADLITVPSTFNIQTFVDAGVDRTKLRQLPYGVNLSRFSPTGAPPAHEFRVLFAGGAVLRKGIPYLLKAFARLQHPGKRLSLAGVPSSALVDLMKKHGLWHDAIEVLGHLPQPRLRDVMSRSHVMVLPSIEEGLALVQAQAMACGCPVIATENTGARDLFEHDREGFITPVRDVDALTLHLQLLADDPERRARMGASALQRVRKMGGWSEYGERAVAIYRELLS